MAGKNFPPENDSDYSASRTRMVTVLVAYESSVHGLSYAVSFVSILAILPEIWLAEYGGRWEKLYPGVSVSWLCGRSSRSDNSATRATIHTRIGVCESPRSELSNTPIRMLNVVLVAELFPDVSPRITFLLRIKFLPRDAVRRDAVRSDAVRGGAERGGAVRGRRTKRC